MKMTGIAFQLILKQNRLNIKIVPFMLIRNKVLRIQSTAVHDADMAVYAHFVRGADIVDVCQYLQARSLGRVFGMSKSMGA